MRSPAPRHHHFFGLQPWRTPAVPVGVPGRDLLQCNLFKVFRALTHAGLRQLLGFPVDSPCAEGHSLPRDTVDFPSPDISRPRLEALFGGRV